jgi:ABC-2 type transport system permease protein
MYKLFVIAHREYVAMVGTKAFLFTLVADGTAQLFETIEQAATQRNEALKMLSKKDIDRADKKFSGRDSKDSFMNQQADIWLFTEAPNELTEEQRLEYSRQIRNGELYALVEIPKSLWDDPTKLGVAEAVESTGLESTGDTPTVVPKFYSQDALISGTRSWLGFVISQKMRELRIRQFGLTSIAPEVFSQIDAKVELTPNVPIQASDVGKSKDQSPMDSLIAMFLPFGVMMLMFMVILMAAQPMLESAMEEKSLRISEVLLGSVTPSQLMGGKLIGNVAGSLVILVLYGSGGLFLLNSQGLSDKIPASVLPWFLLFQLLGVLFFSSIFLTVGASVNELKEAQTMLLPVWMVLMAPMMVWFVAVRDPNGVVSTTLSFFPPSCPMMMVLRLASGTTVPFWQPPLAAIIMLVSTFLIVRTAGRIYRAGLLRNEGARSITQLLRRSLAPR